MTQVSKFLIRNDVWERIFDLFIETIADLKDKKKLERFVDDFFSPTEKIMLAKRLAIIVLLAKNQSYGDIRRILRVTPSTIAKMGLKLKYEGKGLKPVVKDIFEKESQIILWKEIAGIFDLPTKASLRSPERYKRTEKRSQEIKTIKDEF